MQGSGYKHCNRAAKSVEKLYLEIRFNLRSVLLDFTEKPVFEYSFACPMILVLSYLVKNSIYRVSAIKLAVKWCLMRIFAS